MAWGPSLFLLCAIVLASAPGVVASPQSFELVRQGAADLANRRVEEALKKFEAAAQADPADAQAVFFQGVALNRLGRSAEALARLERARAMRSDHPDLAFEMGWSLSRLGRWQEAITQLEAYERASPGRGQTSEFLGRAWLALRDYAKAEAALREAIRRDPTLRPTVLFYLVLLEAERGDLPAARRQAEQLLREAPEAPITRTLREQLALPPPVEKPWRVSLSAAGGYNSNVIALGEKSALPRDISSKRSGFARTTLSGSYDWSLTASDTLTGGYAFLSDVYENLSGFDLRDHFFSVDYRHAFREDLVALLRLSDEFAQIGGDDFRNQVTLQAIQGYRLNDRLTLEVGYTFASSDYFFPTNRVQDRDSLTHTVALTSYFTVPGTQWQARVGYFHLWNFADGRDFDFKTNGVTAGLSLPLVWQITGDLSYTRTFDRYDTPNSLAGPTGFEFRRRDDVDTVAVQLSRPIVGEWLRGFARYGMLNVDSNISFFTFHQHVWSLGVIASF